MFRKTSVAVAFAAAWLVFAPLASARPVGECEAYCQHHRGNYRVCYDDCLRR